MTRFTGSDCYNLQVQVYELFTPPLNTYDVGGKCAIPPKGIASDDLTNRSERMQAFIEENGWIWPFGPVPAMGHVRNGETQPTSNGRAQTTSATFMVQNCHINGFCRGRRKRG